MKVATRSLHMRIGIMTIDCGIENQTELFRANLPLRASYSLLQSIFNKSVNRNKIFRTGQLASYRWSIIS